MAVVTVAVVTVAVVATAAVAATAIVGGGRGAESMSRAGTLAAVICLAAAGAPARPAPDVEIRVSDAGFEPSEVTLRKGEAVRIVLSSADREHCFAVDAFRIEKRIARVRPTSFDFSPGRAGRFPFYCCLETGNAAEVERGELVVME